MERAVQEVKVERAVQEVKVERAVQAVVVAVVAKIRNCLMFQILRLEMAMVSQIGAVLSLMVTLVVLGHLQLLALGARVLKI